MEVQSNQNSSPDANASPSNVELTLLGIDKKWVRSNGSWVDKSKLPVVQAQSFDHFVEENQTSSSHWWQFWKA